MPTVDESLGSKSPLASDLKAGVDQISSNQTVVFTKYVRLVLPLDGYVFWVKADLVSEGALFNAAALNAATFNQPGRIVSAAPYVSAQGSLHFSTELKQDETETYAINRVVFTSEQEVKDLNFVGPTVMYIAVVGGRRVAFSNRGAFYRQADLFHYVGNAVYSDMDSQVVDTVEGFNSRQLIVSNSLPFWLAFNGYQPTLPAYGFGNPGITLFPSYLVPSNLPPPYGSVHIDPPSTQAIAGAPRIGRRSSHHQLVQERVRITMYGMRNNQALDFLDCVLQRSLDYGDFGVMNQPTVRDEKRTQVEIAAIGMKKTVEFEINYYQHRANDVARQMIISAIPTYLPQGLVAA